MIDHKILLIILLLGSVGAAWGSAPILDDLHHASKCFGNQMERTEQLADTWKTVYPQVNLRLVSNIRLVSSRVFSNRSLFHCMETCRVWRCAAIKFDLISGHCESSNSFEITRGPRVLYKLRAAKDRELLIVSTDRDEPSCLTAMDWRDWIVTGERDEFEGVLVDPSMAERRFTKKEKNDEKEKRNWTDADVLASDTDPFGVTTWVIPPLDAPKKPKSSREKFFPDFPASYFDVTPQATLSPIVSSNDVNHTAIEKPTTTMGKTEEEKNETENGEIPTTTRPVTIPDEIKTLSSASTIGLKVSTDQYGGPAQTNEGRNEHGGDSGTTKKGGEVTNRGDGKTTGSEQTSTRISTELVNGVTKNETRDGTTPSRPSTDTDKNNGKLETEGSSSTSSSVTDKSLPSLAPTAEMKELSSVSSISSLPSLTTSGDSLSTITASTIETRESTTVSFTTMPAMPSSNGLGSTGRLSPTTLEIKASEGAHSTGSTTTTTTVETTSRVFTGTMAAAASTNTQGMASTLSPTIGSTGAQSSTRTMPMTTMGTTATTTTGPALMTGTTVSSSITSPTETKESLSTTPTTMTSPTSVQTTGRTEGTSSPTSTTMSSTTISSTVSRSTSTTSTSASTTSTLTSGGSTPRGELTCIVAVNGAVIRLVNGETRKFNEDPEGRQMDINSTLTHHNTMDGCYLKIELKNQSLVVFPPSPRVNSTTLHNVSSIACWCHGSTSDSTTFSTSAKEEEASTFYTETDSSSERTTIHSSTSEVKSTSISNTVEPTSDSSTAQLTSTVTSTESPAPVDPTCSSMGCTCPKDSDLIAYRGAVSYTGLSTNKLDGYWFIIGSEPLLNQMIGSKIDRSECVQTRRNIHDCSIPAIRNAEFIGNEIVCVSGSTFMNAISVQQGVCKDPSVLKCAKNGYQCGGTFFDLASVYCN